MKKTHITTEARRRNMQAIRSKDTKPELLVRSTIHRLGYRYRLHRQDLPGKPDLVFSPRRKIVFIHGCFWHQHSCKSGRVPRSNNDYWKPKLARNVFRDARQITELSAAGWKVLVVWECETKNIGNLRRRLVRFLRKKGE